MHVTTRRKSTLALDLLEEFRVPIVDAAVFNTFRKGRLPTLNAKAREEGVFERKRPEPAYRNLGGQVRPDGGPPGT